jgi:hypothetical protein
MNRCALSSAEKDTQNYMSQEETSTATLAAPVAAQGAKNTRETASSKKRSSSKKHVARTKKTAKRGKPEASSKKQANVGSKSRTPRAKHANARPATGKGTLILDLIGGPEGATLTDLMKTTGWQAHSVRGFLSTAARKHGIKIESSKNDAGERRYAII